MSHTFGYASGVVAAKVPDWGEFVLAELTQTFDRDDLTYFFPLLNQVERRLGHKPSCGDFDAWYVYDYFHQAEGFAAVPQGCSVLKNIAFKMSF